MSSIARGIGITVLCIFAASLAACGGGGSSSSGGSSNSGTVNSIAVTAASSTLAVGATETLTATAKDASGNTLSGITFTWSSSDSAVATVDSAGVVTGVAAGSADITASASGVSSAAAKLTVATAAAVKGTAALGAPIAGGTVTLVDSQGTSVSGKTGSDGSYSLDVTGLQAPFLVSVEAGGSSPTTLYSVSADTSGVINVTPLTDLIIRSWYEVQGESIAPAFGNPVSDPPPSASSVQLLSNVVVQVMSLWLQNAGVATSNFSPISTAFSANGSGEDAVLAETTVNTSAGTVTVTGTVSGSSVTQNSQFNYDTSTSAVTADTSITGSAGSSSAQVSTALPVSSAESAALDGIDTLLSNFAAAVTKNSSNLSVSVTQPFFDANAMWEGFGSTDTAGRFAYYLQSIAAGATVTAVLDNLTSLDTSTGVAEGTITLSASGSSLTTLSTDMQFKQQTDGSWLLYGDQRIALASIAAQMNTYAGATTTGPCSTCLSIDVQVPQSYSVSGVTLTGGSLFNNTSLQSQGTITRTYVPTVAGATVSDTVDDFGPNSTTAISSPIPAGTPFTFTLAAGTGNISYTDSLNAYTDEPMYITNSPHSSLAAVVGQPIMMKWSLPTTFAVGSIESNWETHTSGGNTCNNDLPALSPGTTSETITIASTCNGQAVTSANFYARAVGVNGEQTQANYYFQ